LKQIRRTGSLYNLGYSNLRKEAISFWTTLRAWPLSFKKPTGTLRLKKKKKKQAKFQNHLEEKV
jgi:hypothetical protein